MSRVITEQWAAGALSVAYSDLKDKHYELVLKYKQGKKIIENLREELYDVNQRYLELTRYVNNLPEQTGIYEQ